MKITPKNRKYLREEFIELCFCSSEGAFRMDSKSACEIADWFISEVEMLPEEKVKKTNGKKRKSKNE